MPLNNSPPEEIAMSASVEALKLFVNESTGQLRRASQLEQEGNNEDAQAVQSEWKDASAVRTFYLSVDSFVRQ